METPGSYTILRIKRKRTEEPLDALVIESRVRRKKSRGVAGVFQFAQTVEEDTWEDAQRRRDLQNEISRLARETALKANQPTISASPTAPPSPIVSRKGKEDLRRYTVVQTEAKEPESQRLPTSPPKVISSKDIPKNLKNQDFQMYDAILSHSETTESVLDSEMEKFMPMLNDYLHLHDISLPAEPSTPRIGATSSFKATEKDDYVYDVFYHRPATLSEWNEAANVGTLTGLPPSLTDPYDSASDSEEEDNADEDSNAEEYYKNDYPEEDETSSDSAGSDAFHEDSDNDIMQYDDDGDDHEWR